MSLSSAGKIGAFGSAFLDSYDRSRDRRKQEELQKKKEKRENQLFKMEQERYEQNQKKRDLEIKLSQLRLAQLTQDKAVADVLKDVISGSPVDRNKYDMVFGDKYAYSPDDKGKYTIWDRKTGKPADRQRFLLDAHLKTSQGLKTAIEAARQNELAKIKNREQYLPHIRLFSELGIPEAKAEDLATIAVDGESLGLQFDIDKFKKDLSLGGVGSPFDYFGSGEEERRENPHTKTVDGKLYQFNRETGEWGIAPGFQPVERYGSGEGGGTRAKSRSSGRSPVELSRTDKESLAESTMDALFGGQELPVGGISPELRQEIVNATSTAARLYGLWGGKPSFTPDLAGHIAATASRYNRFAAMSPKERMETWWAPRAVEKHGDDYENRDRVEQTVREMEKDFQLGMSGYLAALNALKSGTLTPDDLEKKFGISANDMFNALNSSLAMNEGADDTPGRVYKHLKKFTNKDGDLDQKIAVESVAREFNLPPEDVESIYAFHYIDWDEVHDRVPNWDKQEFDSRKELASKVASRLEGIVPRPRLSVGRKEEGDAGGDKYNLYAKVFDEQMLSPEGPPDRNPPGVGVLKSRYFDQPPQRAEPAEALAVLSDAAGLGSSPGEGRPAPRRVSQSADEQAPYGRPHPRPTQDAEAGRNRPSPGLGRAWENYVDNRATGSRYTEEQLDAQSRAIKEAPGEIAEWAADSVGDAARRVKRGAERVAVEPFTRSSALLKQLGKDFQEFSDIRYGDNSGGVVQDWREARDNAPAVDPISIEGMSVSDVVNVIDKAEQAGDIGMGEPMAAFLVNLGPEAARDIEVSYGSMDSAARAFKRWAATRYGNLEQVPALQAMDEFIQNTRMWNSQVYRFTPDNLNVPQSLQRDTPTEEEMEAMLRQYRQDHGRPAPPAWR